MKKETKKKLWPRQTLSEREVAEVRGGGPSTSPGVITWWVASARDANLFS